MKPIFYFLIFINTSLAAQNYFDTIKTFQQNYVAKHEVVKGEDGELLQFFKVSERHRVIAKFERTENSPWFKMDASGSFRPLYRVYGKVFFKVSDTAVVANVYQSQNLMAMEEFKEDLFIPFTDATSGQQSYEGGRYIDFKISDIKNNNLVIDFNKAYNPYCAYVSNVYSCPIPPKENNLSVSILAGEKKYEKNH